MVYFPFSKWIRLHNEELHSFMVIKSRRLRGVGHVARKKKVGLFSKLNLQERDLSEGLALDRKRILEFIFTKWLSIRGIGLIWLRVWIIGEPL